MNVSTWTSNLRAIGGFFSLLLCAGLASGQSPDQYQDQSQAGEIRQIVARISYISGGVSFARGDDPDNWQAADRNVPMSLGDRVYTNSGSRLELQIDGGDWIRLDGGSELAVLDLTDETKQFSVKAGVASFHIGRLDENEIFEVDTPNAAVTFDRPGDYRIGVDPNGYARIVAWRGSATVAAGGGQVVLDRGKEMRVDGIDDPRYDVVAAAAPDAWDRWVQARDDRTARSPSSHYVSADVVGVNDLDDYGRWQDIPQYGRVWAPASVGNDWAPYRVGHWVWQDPWGWTWVSSEPWGWAPYHYGRWVNASSRWYWVPVAPSVRFVRYAPALVAFVGGGPGWSASVTFGAGGGFVGWFPLAPREQMIPWWGRQSAGVNVTNVTYVNKTYVTVVNQNTFVSGRVVMANLVRDRAVMRDVAAAPVLRGPIPVVPTRDALRVSVRTDLPPPSRPPAAVVGRSVVVRSAPPPAPPTFQAKVDTIRGNRGAPVEPAAAARISVAARGRAEAVTNVRPVAAESGRVTLAPRSSTAGAAPAARPQPVAPVRGRTMATTERPVSSGPASSPAAPSTREAAPLPRGEAAPRPAAEATAAPRQAPPSERGRPPAERVAPPEQPLPAQGRESVAPTPRPQPERAAEPPARGRESVAPTPRPQPERAAEPPARGRESVAPTPRPQPERVAEPPARRRESVAPTPRPQPERAAQPPARGRESVAPTPRPQPERVAQPEKKTLEKEKDKKARDEKDKKDEKEKKPTPGPS